MSFGLIASVVLSLLVAWYVISPLLEPALNRCGAQGAGDGIDALLDRKERSLRAIKDLELDFEMGKLSQEDFDRSKASLFVEAAAILEEIAQKGRA